MTYQELFDALHVLAKVAPQKMKDQVAYVDIDATVHGVSHTEYNDGSVSTYNRYQLLLMEV